MKTLLALPILLVTVAVTAALDIPRSVFRINQLDEAQAEAAEDEKPLVFVYTDPGTS